MKTLRRRFDTASSQGYWEVKSKSLVSAMNRAILLVEVMGEDNVEIVHTRSRKGKHVIVLKQSELTTPPDVLESN